MVGRLSFASLHVQHDDASRECCLVGEDCSAVHARATCCCTRTIGILWETCRAYYALRESFIMYRRGKSTRRVQEHDCTRTPYVCVLLRNVRSEKVVRTIWEVKILTSTRIRTCTRSCTTTRGNGRWKSRLHNVIMISSLRSLTSHIADMPSRVPGQMDISRQHHKLHLYYN